MEHTTLYYREGASDKVYQAALESKDGGYVVTFAYGRRGTTLTTGTKTQEPVAYGRAKQLYDKLIAEKTAKGYTLGEVGTPYRQTGKELASTGIHCQLLNPVTEDQAGELIDNQAYCAQEKFDGRRMLIRKQGDSITGINRLGLTIGIPENIAASAGEFPADFIMDGEAIGDQLHVFDLLSFNGEDTRSWAYRDRYLQLIDLFGLASQHAIQLVTTAFLASQKRAFCQRFRAEGKEGIVFKQLEAPYTSGRPSSGGTQFKLKFTESASFIVSRINEKRSVSLMLFNNDRVVPAGNVTIPPNHEIPQVGSTVECRYLYAHRSGSIFQPVYLGQREDIRAEECVVGQLKYKPEPARVDAA